METDGAGDSSVFLFLIVKTEQKTEANCRWVGEGRGGDICNEKVGGDGFKAVDTVDSVEIWRE